MRLARCVMPLEMSYIWSPSVNTSFTEWRSRQAAAARQHFPSVTGFASIVGEGLIAAHPGNDKAIVRRPRVHG